MLFNAIIFNDLIIYIIKEPIADQRYFYLDKDEYEVLESTKELQVTVRRSDAQYPGSVGM